MPLIRGGYAMAIVVSWFTYNKATGLFFTYLITLFSTVYFASLTFYLFEFKVNPDVKCYQDALWWAAMDVTTVGSNIEAVTESMLIRRRCFSCLRRNRRVPQFRHAGTGPDRDASSQTDDMPLQGRFHRCEAASLWILTKF